MVLWANFTKHAKKNWYTPLLNTSKKTEEEGTLSNLNNEANIILIPIPDKDNRKNYKPTSLKSIDGKILKKILRK